MDANTSNNNLNDVLENLKSQPADFWFDYLFKEYVFKHYEPEEGSPLDTVVPSEKREEVYDKWLEPNVTQDAADAFKEFTDWLNQIGEDASDIFNDFTDWIKNNIAKYPTLNDLIKDQAAPEDLTYDPKNFDPNTPEPDLDRDGIPDWLDPDMDNDGIPDSQDSDRDNDGIPDDIDPDPLTPEPNNPILRPIDTKRRGR